MQLGAFSISLNVKDIAKSRAFYSKIGFVSFGGDVEQGWLMMRNGSTVIGLFNGFLPANSLTFNPGWDQYADDLDSYDDIRELQKNFKANGLVIENEVDENSTGPASFILRDPDGNPILFDQHR